MYLLLKDILPTSIPIIKPTSLIHLEISKALLQKGTNIATITILFDSTCSIVFFIGTPITINKNIICLSWHHQLIKIQRVQEMNRQLSKGLGEEHNSQTILIGKFNYYHNQYKTSSHQNKARGPLFIHKLHIIIVLLGFCLYNYCDCSRSKYNAS